MQLYPNLELPFDIGLPEFGMLRTIVVEKMIGQGLFGHVWRIRDQDSGKQLALEQVKIPDSDALKESEFAIQISQAIEAQVNSPYLPRTYGLVKLDKHEFGILHQWQEASSLKDWIANHGNAPWSEKRACFAQILAGTKSVLEHRDYFDAIALEQIEMSPAGKVILNGYSQIHYKRFLDEKPKFKDRISHESPEQYFDLAGSIDAKRSAIFSLGVLLYSLIKPEPYWASFSKLRPPFKEMLVQDQLSDSNILDTFHPNFTHTAESAIIGLRFGTVFNPEKRNIDFDELIYHFGATPTWNTKTQDIKPEEKPPKDDSPEENIPIDREEEKKENPQKEVVKETPDQSPAIHNPDLPEKKKWFEHTAFVLLLGLVIMGAVAVGAWKLNQQKGSLAEDQLQERSKWQLAQNRNTEFYLKQYLSEYPEGKYRQEAEKKLAELPLPNFELDWLSAKRFTGKINRFDDLQVFSIRLKDLEMRTDRIQFQSSINIGAIRKELSGWIYKSDLKIRFDENTEDPNRFGISDGRLYFDGEEIFFESIDLDQYWILE